MSTLTAPPAQANGRVDVVAGIPVADGAAGALDLYLPQGRGPWPATVYLQCAAHAGEPPAGIDPTTRIDPAEHAERCRGLARRGVAVACATCRPVRGPSASASASAPVRDASAAVRWVQHHGDRFGLTTQAIGAWGSAAGAHLAALLGTGSDPAVVAVGVLLAPVPGTPAPGTLAPGAPRPGAAHRAPARAHTGRSPGPGGPGRVPFLVVHAVPAARFGTPPPLRFRTTLVRRGSHGTGIPAQVSGRDDPRLGSDVVLTALAGFFKEHLA